MWNQLFLNIRESPREISATTSVNLKMTPYFLCQSSLFDTTQLYDNHVNKPKHVNNATDRHGVDEKRSHD